MFKIVLVLLAIIFGFVGGIVFKEKVSHEVKYIPSASFRKFGGVYETLGTIKPLNYTSDDQFEFVRISCDIFLNTCDYHNIILAKEGLLFDEHKIYTLKGVVGNTMLLINDDDRCLEKTVEINMTDGKTILKTTKKSNSDFCSGHTSLRIAELGTYYAQGKKWLD